MLFSLIVFATQSSAAAQPALTSAAAILSVRREVGILAVFLFVVGLFALATYITRRPDRRKTLKQPLPPGTNSSLPHSQPAQFGILPWEPDAFSTDMPYFLTLPRDEAFFARLFTGDEEEIAGDDGLSVTTVRREPAATSMKKSPLPPVRQYEPRTSRRPSTKRHSSGRHSVRFLASRRARANQCLRGAFSMK